MAGRTIRVGNVEITSLSDGNLEFDLCNFFPNIPEENWQQYQHHLTEERHVRFNLASYLVRSEGKNILVDTGMGPKPADAPETPWGELMHDMEAHGVRPEDIDLVVMTHLHRDHVGWNLQPRHGKFEPTFPRAQYWVSIKDWNVCHRPDIQRQRFPNAPTCVLPLGELDAGRVEFIDGEHPITRELTTIPTPGHTPGHHSILITSQGERAMILGDVAHNPAQVTEPEWVSRADMDPATTQATRRAIMERLEEQGMLAVIGHFPLPGFGKIVKVAGRRYWQALP